MSLPINLLFAVEGSRTDRVDELCAIFARPHYQTYQGHPVTVRLELIDDDVLASDVEYRGQSNPHERLRSKLRIITKHLCDTNKLDGVTQVFTVETCLSLNNGAQFIWTFDDEAKKTLVQSNHSSVRCYVATAFINDLSEIDVDYGLHPCYVSGDIDNPPGNNTVPKWTRILGKDFCNIKPLVRAQHIMAYPFTTVIRYAIHAYSQ